MSGVQILVIATSLLILCPCWYALGYLAGKRAEYKRQSAEKAARINSLMSGPFGLRPEMIIPGFKPPMDAPSQTRSGIHDGGLHMR